MTITLTPEKTEKFLNISYEIFREVVVTIIFLSKLTGNLVVVFSATVVSEAVVRMCSVKKGVLGNFAKFTGKHLCQRLFFNKVAGLRPATLLEKSLCHRYCWISSGGSIFLYRQLL